jgi:hypothetical protein
MQLAVFLFHLEVLLLPFTINQKEARKRCKTDFDWCESRGEILESRNWKSEAG